MSPKAVLHYAGFVFDRGQRLWGAAESIALKQQQTPCVLDEGFHQCAQFEFYAQYLNYA